MQEVSGASEVLIKPREAFKVEPAALPLTLRCGVHVIAHVYASIIFTCVLKSIEM